MRAAMTEPNAGTLISRVRFVTEIITVATTPTQPTMKPTLASAREVAAAAIRKRTNL